MVCAPRALDAPVAQRVLQLLHRRGSDPRAIVETLCCNCALGPAASDCGALMAGRRRRTAPGGEARRRPPAPAVGRPRPPAANSGVRPSPVVPQRPSSSRPARATISSTLALAGVLCLAGLATFSAATPAMAANNPAPSPPASSSSGGPAPAYRCAFNVDTDAFTGAFGTASAIGWLGDHDSVITCLGGTFLIQDGPQGFFVNDGFGALRRARRPPGTMPTATCPHRSPPSTPDGAHIAITEFADRIVVGGHPYVAVYSRVRVANPTSQPITVDPQPSPSLVPLDTSTRYRPAREGRSTTTMSSRPTVSAGRIPGRARMRSPAPAASTPTSSTCGPSGTHSSVRSHRSACPTPHWSTHTRAASSRRRSLAEGTTSTPASTGTKASTATTSSAF